MECHAADSGRPGAPIYWAHHVVGCDPRREAPVSEIRTGRGLSRRAFVQGASMVGLGVSAGCGRLPFQTEAAQTMPRLGYLSAFAAGDALSAAFVQGLRAQGYVEGQTIVVEYRFAEG